MSARKNHNLKAFVKLPFRVIIHITQNFVEYKIQFKKIFDKIEKDVPVKKQLGRNELSPSLLNSIICVQISMIFGRFRLDRMKKVFLLYRNFTIRETVPFIRVMLENILPLSTLSLGLFGFNEFLEERARISYFDNIFLSGGKEDVVVLKRIRDLRINDYIESKHFRILKTVEKIDFAVKRMDNQFLIQFYENFSKLKACILRIKEVNNMNMIDFKSNEEIEKYCKGKMMNLTHLSIVPPRMMLTNSGFNITKFVNGYLENLKYLELVCLSIVVDDVDEIANLKKLQVMNFHSVELPRFFGGVFERLPELRRVFFQYVTVEDEMYEEFERRLKFGDSKIEDFYNITTANNFQEEFYRKMSRLGRLRHFQLTLFKFHDYMFDGFVNCLSLDKVVIKVEDTYTCNVFKCLELTNISELTLQVEIASVAYGVGDADNILRQNIQNLKNSVKEVDIPYERSRLKKLFVQMSCRIIKRGFSEHVAGELLKKILKLISLERCAWVVVPFKITHLHHVFEGCDVWKGAKPLVFYGPFTTGLRLMKVEEEKKEKSVVEVEELCHKKNIQFCREFPKFAFY